MYMQSSKTRGKIALLARGQLLILEKEHFVIEQRLADGRHRVIPNGLREIKSLDPRAQRRRLRDNLQSRFRVHQRLLANPGRQFRSIPATELVIVY